MKITEFLSERVVNVSSTPVLLNQEKEARYLVIYNDGSGKLFIGGASTSTSTGLPVEPQKGIVLEISENAKVYGVSDSSASVRILEVR